MIKNIIRYKVLVVSMMVFLASFLISGRVSGKIPEPDNIIYGLTGTDVVNIVLEVNGQPIASYTMGDNVDAGDYYVLRVPMDGMEPREPGTAKEGDEGLIYVNGETEPVASLILGERGAIHRHDFLIDDIDLDGLADNWEQHLVNAIPDDPITSVSDLLPGDDFDGDGFTNLIEYLLGTDADDPSSHPALLVKLKRGFNFVSLHSVGELRDLLPVLGDDLEIEKVMGLDTQSGEMVNLIPGDASNPSFRIRGHEGLIIYSKVDKDIGFLSVACPPLDLTVGVNIVGFGCSSVDAMASDLLIALGNDYISSVQRYNAGTGAFETLGFKEDGQVFGADFPIKPGESYFLFMKQEISGFEF